MSKSIDPPLLLVGLSVAAVGAMMLIAKTTEANRTGSPPPPTPNTASLDLLTIQPGQSARITIETSERLPFKPSDDEALKQEAVRNGGVATIESMSPTKIVYVLKQITKSTSTQRYAVNEHSGAIRQAVLL